MAQHFTSRLQRIAAFTSPLEEAGVKFELGEDHHRKLELIVHTANKAEFGHHLLTLLRQKVPSLQAGAWGQGVALPFKVFETPGLAEDLAKAGALLLQHQIIARQYDGLRIAEKLSSVWGIEVREPCRATVMPEASEYFFHTNGGLAENPAAAAADRINEQFRAAGVGMTARASCVVGGGYKIEFPFDMLKSEAIVAEIVAKPVDLRRIIEMATTESADIEAARARQAAAVAARPINRLRAMGDAVLDRLGL